MKLDQIEAFLAVVETGTMIKAAEKLFISQSNISNRLANLEADLEVTLFQRERGGRQIRLTPYGERFYLMAKQIEKSIQDSYHIKNISPKIEIAIASVDAVNTYTFPIFYRRFMEEHPNVNLRICTHHSNEIHELVESQQVDIGFVYSEHTVRNVKSRPIFRELNYLVCHKDSEYFEGMDNSLLDLSKEVYLKWSPDYENWHYHYFGENPQKLVTVNTGSLISQFITEPGIWSIAPMSVIKTMEERGEIRYYRLKNQPPPRICYELTANSVRPDVKEVLTEFREELINFIESDESICTFHSWMLEN